MINRQYFAERKNIEFKRELPNNHEKFFLRFIVSDRTIYLKKLELRNHLECLGCSKSKATNIMNAMKATKVIEKVTGLGAGKYKFTKL